MVDFEVREADLAGFQSLMIPPVREGFRKPRPKVPSGSRSTSGLAESNYKLYSRIRSTEAPVFPSGASCLADVSESRSYSVDSSTAESITSTEITVKSVTLLIWTSLVAQDHRIIPL